jgi:dihydrodipicolinate reductase
MRIAVVGALGKMGRSIIEEAHRESGFEISGLIEARDSRTEAHLDEVMARHTRTWHLSSGHLCEDEVVIDFSSPRTGARWILSSGGIPLVCGTTGLPDSSAAALVDFGGNIVL